MPPSLTECLDAALNARADLIDTLTAEDTDAYRLFHGSVEGRAGLTVDRYGDALLAQSFHQTLPASDLADLTAFYAERAPNLPLVWNDRSGDHSRIANPLDDAAQQAAEAPRTFRELGVTYAYQARHTGQDPWLFLDLRAGRRQVMRECAGKTLLNVFAYTCGVGVAAATAGATQVVNVDFAAGSLAIGRENARLNRLTSGRRNTIDFVRSDAFPALRQYAGLGQPAVVRGKRLPHFPQLAPQTFDRVFLDPPRYARSPFGVVDLINDYPAVFKPALLATAEGGVLYCCNNVAQVGRDAWLGQLTQSARKAGRPLRGATWIDPEADFPSPDGNPPLKMLRLAV